MRIDEIKGKILPILDRVGAKRPAIFGSFATGNENDNSDIDILVELPDSFSLLDYIKLKHEIEDVVGRKVDLVEYDALKPMIRDAILNQAVSI